jgi:O-antigen/teichoic acid export membrane protein
MALIAMNVFLSGFVSLFAGNLLSLILNFGFAVLLLQKLMPAEYGLQSALVAFGAITISFADLGLYDVSTRELTRQPREKLRDTFTSLLGMRLALSGAVCTVAIIIALLPNSFPGEQFATFLLALFTLVFSFASTSAIESLLAATGHTRQIAVLQSIYAVATSVIGSAILLLGGRLTVLYISFTILSLIMIALYLRQAQRILPEGIGVAFRPRQWRYFLAQSLSGGIGQSCMTFCLRFGTYLIYTFVNREGAGYIGLSSQLYQAMIVLIWAPYAISILPVLTRLQTQSEDKLKWLSARSLTWLMAAVLPITVGSMLLAAELLDLLKHGQGVNIAPIMRIFIWVLPLDMLQGSLYRILLVIDQQHRYLIAAGIAALSNVVLCVVLIPTHGVEGAAVSAVASMGVLVALCAWSLRRWLLPHLRPLDAIRLALALTGMTIAVLATPDWFFLFRIGIGAIVYGLILLRLHLFSLSDWQITRQLMGSEHPTPVPFWLARQTEMVAGQESVVSHPKGGS